MSNAHGFSQIKRIYTDFFLFLQFFVNPMIILGFIPGNLYSSVIIRVNPWPFNYSFKSYLVDGSQRNCAGLIRNCT